MPYIKKWGNFAIDQDGKFLVEKFHFDCNDNENYHIAHDLTIYYEVVLREVIRKCKKELNALYS